MAWRIIHKAETESTNRDARLGSPWDVFTADFQSAGRGRLDHKWHSRRGENLMMSAVVDVAGLAPDLVATFPLVVGLSACEAIGRMLPSGVAAKIKWPNDVLVDGRKVAGILCELDGEKIIAGVGVNVLQTDFPPEISSRATSLALAGVRDPSVTGVRDAILERLSGNWSVWRTRGFAAHLPRIAELDCLKGCRVSVLRADDDAEPVSGLCAGIDEDGSLVVAGERIYAGEAHVKNISTTPLDFRHGK